VDPSVENNLSVKEVTENILKMDKVIQAVIANKSTQPKKKKRKKKEKKPKTFR